MQYILVHGLGQNASSWDKTIPSLRESAHISCPDLWEILDAAEVTYVNLYRAFKDYCNAIPGSLNLCGLSLGAILSLNFALDYPEKVQSLVLIGAQYKMPKGLLKFQNIVFRLMPRTAFTKMGMQKNDVIKLTASMANLDYSEKLKNISCGTLVLCGENDNANKKAAKTIVEKIPNAEFRLMKNAGHEVNIDAPDELATMLNDFWSQRG